MCLIGQGKKQEWQEWFQNSHGGNLEEGPPPQHIQTQFLVSQPLCVKCVSVHVLLGGSQQERQCKLSPWLVWNESDLSPTPMEMRGGFVSNVTVCAGACVLSVLHCQGFSQSCLVGEI